ncbi:DUF6457 domain-containing protein [Kytococcus sp. Marseille-QA3725]
MSTGRTHDLPEDPARWDAWAARAREALGLPETSVDVATLHRLASTVAHQVERPLVPVSTFLVGQALASQPGLTLEEAVDRVTELAQEGPLTDHGGVAEHGETSGTHGTSREEER